ncbi:MAG: SDR family oxidoreductase [Defluviitaleaceae bacterium]|nr:SDR family oxidoreductase [Defluviitaleaceae bacterium]
MDYDREYFSGKTAVVTGAASGIGLALVEELLISAAEKVVMADINQANLTEHEAKLNAQYGGRVKGIPCNVTVEEDVKRLISQSTAFFDGKLDLLFNNAGAGFAGWFADMTDADWKAAFDLNFYSALYGMRAALPIMKKQGGGQIINTISGIAFMPMAMQSRYAATKAALNALSVALRSEYWDDNIKISSATPGTTATNIFAAGGHTAPDFAQSPQQSASRILNGVVNNDRIIFGDDGDVSGGMYGTHPESQKGNDEYLLRVARERREGKVAF